MERKHQIRMFEDQIDYSIKLRVDQLRISDPEEAKLLSSLKSEILKQIKRDRDDDPATPDVTEEKISEDLKLSSKDMALILHELIKTHPQLLRDSGIDSYSAFEDLMGFGIKDLEYRDGLQRLTLFGEAIEIAMPLNINEHTERNYLAALRQIEEREKFRDYINSDTKFVSNGGVRIEFSIKKGRKIVKYTATPDGVFRIDEDNNTLKGRRNLNRLRKKMYEMHRRFRGAVNKDKDLSVSEKAVIDSFEDSPEEIEDLIFSVGLPSDYKVPKKYQDMIRQISKLMKQTYLIFEKSKMRLLFDEEAGAVVKEVAHFGNGLNNFTHLHLDADGNTTREDQYALKKKDISFVYFPGRQIMKERILYGENGNVAVLSQYDEKGELERITVYKEDGTIRKVRIGDIDYMYDEVGKVITFASLSGTSEYFMLGPNKELFGSLEYEKKKNPDMREGEYFARFRKVVTNAKQLSTYNTLFMQDLKCTKTLWAEFRAHAKEITGVAKKEAKLESKYGIEIETENWNLGEDTTCDRISIYEIGKMIDELDVALAMYPPVFLENSGLKKIYLFKNLETSHSKYGMTRSGGIAFDKGRIVVDSIEWSLAHEIYHCADRAYDGFENENPEWGEKAHGAEYEEIYGESGWEAINSGIDLSERPTGHPSGYGKHGGIDEDQADMAEALMDNEDEVLKHLPNEPALAKKVEMTKEFYYKVSEGRMDAVYWADMRAGKKIDGEYWEKREAANDFVIDSRFKKQK